ncbi:MAG: sodium-dependent transporter [Treponema sp.]|nr:sodium-dependent transporter [Treponema sp.]
MSDNTNNREKLSSRLGFLLLSAGCAVGLGNVWRFPFITGRYGGALFVLIYLVFLVIFGIPVMAMEFSVGRASGKSAARSFHVLEKPDSKWHLFSWAAMAGNYILMMFYTTVSGWMIAYMVKVAKGDFTGLDTDQVEGIFGAFVSSPIQMVGWMIVVCILGFGICAGGLVNSVEKVAKVMMLGLYAIIIILVIRVVTLPGAAAGLEFYLKPNLNAIKEHGLFTVLFAAMGQAFFTLSLGVGSMAIFGSYIGKEKRLGGEAITVTILDTSAAFLAGLVVLPACAAFGLSYKAGPGLIFMTLPNVFNSMAGGRIWGTLFFLFMTFAAMSTVVAVFENIVAFAMDITGCSRRKSVFTNFFVLVILSLPCALGFNLLSGFTFMGGILDLEDFILSNNLLPLGALCYALFCVSKMGWGFDNFIKEANTGSGIIFPAKLKYYFVWGLPVLLIAFYIFGYVQSVGVNALQWVLILGIIVFIYFDKFYNKSKNS